MRRINAKGFEMEVDDGWVERWDPDIARQSHMTEDECFAALRVTFTLTKDEAIALLGKDNLPTLSDDSVPAVSADDSVPAVPAVSAVSADDLPHNGERWALVKISD